MAETDTFILALHHLKCAENALKSLSAIDDSLNESAAIVREISDKTLETWKEFFGDDAA